MINCKKKFIWRSCGVAFIYLPNILDPWFSGGLREGWNWYDLVVSQRRFSLAWWLKHDYEELELWTWFHQYSSLNLHISYIMWYTLPDTTYHYHTERTARGVTRLDYMWLRRLRSATFSRIVKSGGMSRREEMTLRALVLWTEDKAAPPPPGGCPASPHT